MADDFDLVKISQLPAATTPGQYDVLAGVQTGDTKQFSFATLLSWMEQAITAEAIGAVPVTRTVNGKALATNIALTASDVGAQPTITASGILKGDGSGGISVAVAGTDYQTPLVAGTDYATPAMIPSVPDPSDATPQALGTAAAGSSGDYSRSDHVHGMPSTSDVGAAPAAAGVYYGTSDTAAAAQAKTATVPGVTELYDGLRICVWFAHAQNYNGQPTLNVNSLGAKPVNRTPTVAAVRYEWGPGVVDLVYSEASDIWVIVKGTHGGSERYGVVLLSDAVNSSSDTVGGTAATPSAVKAAYDAAISAQDMAAKALGDPAGVNAAVGEYVSYNGGLYTVNTAITSDMAASVFASYLDAVPDGGLNALNNQTLDGVYSCYGYRANLISTVDVQLKKDYVTDGTTYRIFAPLYLIDFNSPQTVDEYYLMLDQNNPSRFVRVTGNNSNRNITATAFDPATGVLTLTLNGTRRYVGADVRIAKQLI